METLIKKFRNKHKDSHFTYQEALQFGIDRGKFYQLVERGEFERVQRGFYRLNDYFPLTVDHQLRDASKLIKAKSAVSLMSALTYYGLTDEFINRPILLVDNFVVSHKKEIYLFRKRDPRWRIGIEKKEGFNITSVERTIVESMIYRKLTGYEGIHALRKILNSGKTDISKISKMAKKLGYFKRLEKNLEVFY